MYGIHSMLGENAVMDRVLTFKTIFSLFYGSVRKLNIVLLESNNLFTIKVF